MRSRWRTGHSSSEHWGSDKRAYGVSVSLYITLTFVMQIFNFTDRIPLLAFFSYRYKKIWKKYTSHFHKSNFWAPLTCRSWTATSRFTNDCHLKIAEKWGSPAASRTIMHGERFQNNHGNYVNVANLACIFVQRQRRNSLLLAFSRKYSLRAAATGRLTQLLLLYHHRLNISGLCGRMKRHFKMSSSLLWNRDGHFWQCSDVWETEEESNRMISNGNTHLLQPQHFLQTITFVHCKRYNVEHQTNGSSSYCIKKERVNGITDTGWCQPGLVSRPGWTMVECVVFQYTWSEREERGGGGSRFYMRINFTWVSALLLAWHESSTYAKRNGLWVLYRDPVQSLQEAEKLLFLNAAGTIAYIIANGAAWSDT